MSISLTDHRPMTFNPDVVFCWLILGLAIVMPIFGLAIVVPILPILHCLYWWHYLHWLVTQSMRRGGFGGL